MLFWYVQYVLVDTEDFTVILRPSISDVNLLLELLMSQKMYKLSLEVMHSWLMVKKSFITNTESLNICGCIFCFCEFLGLAQSGDGCKWMFCIVTQFLSGNFKFLQPMTPYGKPFRFPWKWFCVSSRGTRSAIHHSFSWAQIIYKF